MRHLSAEQLVDLAEGKNLREFTRLLCKCLMGGKHLPTAARLLFFAVVDQMLDPVRQSAQRPRWMRERVRERSRQTAANAATSCSSTGVWEALFRAVNVGSSRASSHLRSADSN